MLRLWSFFSLCNAALPMAFAVSADGAPSSPRRSRLLGYHPFCERPSCVQLRDHAFKLSNKPIHSRVWVVLGMVVVHRPDHVVDLDR